MLDAIKPLAVAAALVAASCGTGREITTRYAPEFAPGRTTVAFLGVFQGGRLNGDAWYPLSARLSAPFGKPSCEIAFSDKLKAADAELWAKLDEDVAENGITDEMLATMAPRTDAEIIVTVSIHGRVERAGTSGVRNDPTLPGHRPSHPNARRPHAARPHEQRSLELSASLFSVKSRKSVGRISLRYDGTNLDEAITIFAGKVSEELAGSTCKDWRLEAKAQ